MKIKRSAKCEWKASIELFDNDLRKRMNHIRFNELQYDSAKAEERQIRSKEGRIEKKSFPYWRDQHLEWLYRNQERMNEYHRIYYLRHKTYWKNYYLLNKDHIDAYHKQYYQAHRKSKIEQTIRNKIKRSKNPA